MKMDYRLFEIIICIIIAGFVGVIAGSYGYSIWVSAIFGAIIGLTVGTFTYYFIE